MQLLPSSPSPSHSALWPSPRLLGNIGSTHLSPDSYKQPEITDFDVEAAQEIQHTQAELSDLAQHSPRAPRRLDGHVDQQVIAHWLSQPQDTPSASPSRPPRTPEQRTQAAEAATQAVESAEALRLQQLLQQQREALEARLNAHGFTPEEYVLAMRQLQSPLRPGAGTTALAQREALRQHVLTAGQAIFADAAVTNPIADLQALTESPTFAEQIISQVEGGWGQTSDFYGVAFTAWLGYALGRSLESSGAINKPTYLLWGAASVAIVTQLGGIGLNWKQAEGGAFTWAAQKIGQAIYQPFEHLGKAIYGSFTEDQPFLDHVWEVAGETRDGLFRYFGIETAEDKRRTPEGWVKHQAQQLRSLAPPDTTAIFDHLAEGKPLTPTHYRQMSTFLQSHQLTMAHNPGLFATVTTPSGQPADRPHTAQVNTLDQVTRLFQAHISLSQDHYFAFQQALIENILLAPDPGEPNPHAPEIWYDLGDAVGEKSTQHLAVLIEQADKLKGKEQHLALSQISQLTQTPQIMQQGEFLGGLNGAGILLGTMGFIRLSAGALYWATNGLHAGFERRAERLAEIEDLKSLKPSELPIKNHGTIRQLFHEARSRFETDAGQSLGEPKFMQKLLTAMVAGGVLTQPTVDRLMDQLAAVPNAGEKPHSRFKALWEALLANENLEQDGNRVGFGFNETDNVTISQANEQFWDAVDRASKDNAWQLDMDAAQEKAKFNVADDAVSLIRNLRDSEEDPLLGQKYTFTIGGQDHTLTNLKETTASSLKNTFSTTLNRTQSHTAAVNSGLIEGLTEGTGLSILREPSAYLQRFTAQITNFIGQRFKYDRAAVFSGRTPNGETQYFALKVSGNDVTMKPVHTGSKLNPLSLLKNIKNFFRGQQADHRVTSISQASSTAEGE